MISGFVNIIKPTGATSFEVISKVKKILGTKKVGHLGTLDPAASGVLPIAVGKATKFFDYFLNKEKEYVALVNFGKETDTLDSFGIEIGRVPEKISEEMILDILPKFTGEISQTPPKFSAIKVNGERAYDLARKNANFELKPRKITIFSIKMVKNCQNNKFLFKVHCSAGTYIRTLFLDIAKALSTVATAEAIIRTKSGNFKIEDAVTIDEFEKSKSVKSIESVFENCKKIFVSGETKKKLVCGVKVSSSGFDVSENEEFFAECDEGIIGFYKALNGKIEQIVYLFDSGNTD